MASGQTFGGAWRKCLFVLMFAFINLVVLNFFIANVKCILHAVNEYRKILGLQCSCDIQCEFPQRIHEMYTQCQTSVIYFKLKG